jgi:hypothetical protein
MSQVCDDEQSLRQLTRFAITSDPEFEICPELDGKGAQAMMRRRRSDREDAWATQ